MPLTIITPAEAEPVTIAEAKSFARVDTDADDDLIAGLIAAAREHVELSTGRQLVQVTLELNLRQFPYYHCGLIRLPRNPVISVDSVKYRDRDGNLQELVAEIDFLSDTAAEPGTVEPVNTWPVTGDYPDAVQIRFVAGYAPNEDSPVDHAANVPARAKVAVKALVAHWHENRPAADTVQVHETPFHVARLINGLRIWGQS